MARVMKALRMPPASVFALSFLVASINCFPQIKMPTARKPQSSVALGADFQRDFGRGAEHLSFLVEPGDLLAYATGSWHVDGVEVGGGEREVLLLRADTLQVVWTHNCEHGYIRGFVCEIAGGGVQETENYVEVGPEQILCRMDDEVEAVSLMQSGSL